MNELNVRNIKKTKMYYARTYRSLKKNNLVSVLYLLFLVLPLLIALLLHYGDISVFVSKVTAKALQVLLPGVSITFGRVNFIPWLGSIQTVVLPTTYPSFWFTMANLGVSFLILFISLRGKGRSRPLPIFLSIMMFIHIINCSFFIFAPSGFPYGTKEFSSLYMEQQIGIWISFLFMSGLVTGILGSRNILLRFATLFFTMLYSFALGLLRYIFALYVVYQFSAIYIALFFFALGPFFDFLYFVGIYGFFLDRMIKKSHNEKSLEEWKWS